MLGEITGGNTRGYWKCEDENDSSPNGFNLTNQNSVIFNPGRFTKAADFGSSGTNKALTYSSNVLSSGEPTDVCFSFWYKLNNTTSSNTNARFFELVTINNSASGLRCICYYNISGGGITISFAVGTTSGNRTITKTIAVDSNWHLVLVRKINDVIALQVDNFTTELVNSTGLADRTTAGITTTYNIAIGNGATALGPQAWAMIEEFFIKEFNVLVNNYYPKYHTQTKGRFCI